MKLEKGGSEKVLTKIEIDGFKTFKDFKVELAPFQVIVGPNGSVKSNLFDALKLLSHLADNDLSVAFQGLRGDIDELFTTLPGGKSVDRIRIAVEMLVDRKVQDSGGGEVELVGEVALKRQVALKFTRLRYELEITLGVDEYGLERLTITHESLKSIPQDEDNWRKKYGLSLQNNWLSETSGDQGIFIDTKLTTIAILESLADKSTAEAKQLLIYLYPDGDKRERIRRFYTAEVQRTVMSRVVDTEHPHVFAVREELCSLRFLHLNPESLRQPSSTKATSSLSQDGKNMPTTLARMQAEDKFALNDVSRDLANLVPDLIDIELRKDEVRNEYTIWASFLDGRSFSSQVLSDGTLRLLALTILRNDPQFRGILCIEEPENGVNPMYLKKIGQLLRKMATDFNDPEQVDEPLRQVLITTHSPTFISQPGAIDALLFAYTVTQIEPQKYSLQITQMAPVVTSNTQEKLNDIDEAEESYTLHQIERYLDSGYLDEARKNLGCR